MDRTHAEAGKALDTQLQDLSKALKELDSKIDSKASSKEIHEVKEIQTRQQNQLDALEASVRAIHEKLDSIFGAAPEQEIIPQDEQAGLITPPGPPTRPLSPDSPGTLRFGTPAPRFTSVRNGVSHVEPEQPQQAAAALDPSWNISREQLNVYLGPWKYEGKPGTLEEYARVQMLKVMSIGQRSRRATALPDCFVSTVEALGTNHKGKKLPVALTSKSTQPLQDSAGLDKAEMVAPSEMANRSTSSLDATTHEPEAIMRDERAEGASSSGENIVEESSSAPGEDFDLDDINMINGPTPKRHISDEHQILCSDTEGISFKNPAPKARAKPKGTNGGVEKTILNNTVPQKPTQSKRKPSPGPHSASSKRSKPGTSFFARFQRPSGPPSEGGASYCTDDLYRERTPDPSPQLKNTEAVGEIIEISAESDSDWDSDESSQIPHRASQDIPSKRGPPTKGRKTELRVPNRLNNMSRDYNAGTTTDDDSSAVEKGSNVAISVPKKITPVLLPIHGPRIREAQKPAGVNKKSTPQKKSTEDKDGNVHEGSNMNDTGEAVMANVIPQNAVPRVQNNAAKEKKGAKKVRKW